MNERLVAEVLACVLAWPEHAPACVTGPAAVEGVAATIGRHPRDVADVFERFGVVKALALWCLSDT